MSLMKVKDLEIVQTTLDLAGLDYQLELEDGKISIVRPSDIVSSERRSINSSRTIPGLGDIYFRTLASDF